MAADRNARETLVRFLDEQAFEPILRVDPEQYSGPERQKLEHVKGATERTRQRYHDDYTSAEDVCDRFRDDLSSSAAQRVQREIESLACRPCRTWRTSSKTSVGTWASGAERRS